MKKLRMGLLAAVAATGLGWTLNASAEPNVGLAQAWYAANYDSSYMYCETYGAGNFQGCMSEAMYSQSTWAYNEAQGYYDQDDINMGDTYILYGNYMYATYLLYI